MKALAENIRSCRINAGKTQQQIAELLGVHHVTYGGYERGEHTPDAETIVKLADIFKVSTDYLLGRYGRTEERQII